MGWINKQTGPRELGPAGRAIRDRLNYKNPSYIIRVENQTSVQILIDYLNKYPLLSSKRMDFKDWEKSFSLIVEKKHLTVQGKEIILAAPPGRLRKL